MNAAMPECDRALKNHMHVPKYSHIQECCQHAVPLANLATGIDWSRELGWMLQCLGDTGHCSECATRVHARVCWDAVYSTCVLTESYQMLLMQSRS